MIVYLATSPSNKVYVGMTKHSMNRRKSSHKRAASSGDTRPFPRAIRKYGDSIKWEVLAEVGTFEEACELEKFYIAKYDSTNGLKGYNISKGGQGTNGVACPNWKRELHRLQMTGLKRTESNKTNCSLSKGGRRFEVVRLDGSVVGVWQNLRQCERDLNIPKPHIWRCLKGLRNSTRDLKFRYIED